MKKNIYLKSAFLILGIGFFSSLYGMEDGLKDEPHEKGARATSPRSLVVAQDEREPAHDSSQRTTLGEELFRFYVDMSHPGHERVREKTNIIYSEERRHSSWEDVRGMFAFAEPSEALALNIIPMNAANFCPPFKLVSEITHEFQQDLDHNVHMQHRIELFTRIVERSRESVAKSLNVDKEEIAFTRNTSESNNSVNNCYRFRNLRGRVLVWDENHHTNDKLLWGHRMGDEDRVDVVTLTEVDLQNKDNVVRAFLEGINEDTEVVTFTELSNTTGTRLPTKEICNAIHNGLKDYKHSGRKEYKARPNIHIHVDGAQSWGSLRVDLRDMDCDSFSASAHKWLCGPREVGILYVRNSAITHFKMPNVVAYDGRIVFHTDIPRNAGRFELLGQRNDASLLAIGLANDVHLRINAEVGPIEERLWQLGDALRGKLSDPSFSEHLKIVTPSSPDLRNSIIVAELLKDKEGKGKPGENLYDYLYTQVDGFERFLTSPQGEGRRIRFCLNFYNTENDITELMRKINAYLLK
ncbi:MAG: aminotransferase class V-fold PLP-dependent enzyme [Proteobacteria bacterium]|nr:aminotransferase class V-fold PLP-dependent enzyme [Pseudomonadota bacterium]